MRITHVFHGNTSHISASQGSEKVCHRDLPRDAPVASICCTAAQFPGTKSAVAGSDHRRLI